MPLIVRLSLIFLAAVGAVVAAMGGIVLIVLGSTRGRRGWVAGGIACGMVGFGAMLGAIVWAMRMDALSRQ